MERKNSNFTFFTQTKTLLTILLITTTLLPKTIAKPPQKKPFNKIYAFGDSYTDTGNTVSSTAPTGFKYVSSPPYGMTYFHHPTNRYSDGRIIIDFVAKYLSLPFLPPYKSTNGSSGTNGVNFAVGGATAIEHKFFARNNLTLDVINESIGTELRWFSRVLEKDGCSIGSESESESESSKCRELFDEGLVWVGEIGANDYVYSVESSVNQKSVQALALKRVFGFFQVLLKKGAKYMVVQGLSPRGCITLSKFLASTYDRDDIGCVKSQNILSSMHNTLLQAEIKSLRKQFPKSIIVYADFYNSYREIMKNLGKYGFKEAFKACCGAEGGDLNYDFISPCGSPDASACSNPSEYINWDGGHFTEAMNKALFELMIQGGYSYPSFQELISKKLSQE